MASSQNTGGNSRRKPRLQHTNSQKISDNKVINQLNSLYGPTFNKETIQTVAKECNFDLLRCINVLSGISRQRDNYEDCKPNPKSQPSPIKKIRTRSKPNENQNMNKIQLQSEKPVHIAERTAMHPSFASQLKVPNIAFTKKSTGAIKKKPQNQNTYGKMDELIININLGFKVLVLLRGLPGSGKSYLANVIYDRTVGAGENKPEYHIYSTDDFFVWLGRGKYQYNPSRLGEAHEWNQRRVKEGLNRAISPIIVDNTNTEAWEMRAYMADAVAHGYIVHIEEPKTPWAFNESGLSRKTIHGVPRQKIMEMLLRYERRLTVPILMDRFNLVYQYPNLPPQIRKYPQFPDIKQSVTHNSRTSCEMLIQKQNLTDSDNVSSDERSKSVQFRNEIVKIKCDRPIIRYSKRELVTIFLKYGKQIRQFKKPTQIGMEDNTDDDLILSWEAFDSINPEASDKRSTTHGPQSEIKTSDEGNTSFINDAFELLDVSVNFENAQVLIPQKIENTPLLIDFTDVSNNEQNTISHDNRSDSVTNTAFETNSAILNENKCSLEGDSLDMKILQTYFQPSEDLLRNMALEQNTESVTHKKTKLLPSFKGFFNMFKNITPLDAAVFRVEETDAIVKINKSPDVRNASTNTSSADFALLSQDLSTIVVDEHVRVLTARERCIAEGIPIRIPTEPPKVHMLEKSTMTDDCNQFNDDVDHDSNFKDLIAIFPGILRNNLRDIYCRCEGDINWAVDVLLDSQSELEQTSQDNVVDESSLIDDETDMNFELFNFKLDTDHNIHDKKTESNHCKEPSPKTKRKFVRKNSLNEADAKLKKEIEDNFTISEDFYSEHCLKIKQIRHGKAVNDTRKSETESSSTDTDNPSQTEEELTDDEMAASQEEVLELELGLDIINKLDETFGPGVTQYPGGMKPVIQIPMSLAQQLHALWLESMCQQVNAHEEYMQQMLQEDIEFARKLQEQELQLAAAGEKSQTPSLQEIMDMEIALAIAKADSEQCKQETPKDMATRLTQQKLCRMFPEIEESTVCEILQAFDNKYDKTVEMLMNSIDRTITPEEIVMQGQHLVDEAKKTTSQVISATTKRPHIVVREVNVADKQDSKKSENELAEYYRAEAQKELKLRDECLEKARHMYSKGYNLVACYYSEIATVHKHKFEKANAFAASAFLNSHSKTHSNSTTLDLHFLYVPEAISALDIFIDKHLTLIREKNKPHEMLYLITGRGLRSAGGKARVKPAVIKHLKNRNLRFSLINPGLLRVKLRPYATLVNE